MPEGLIGQQTRRTIVFSRTVSNLILLVGVIVALGSLFATGGVYFYRQLLTRENADLTTKINALEDDIRQQSVNQQILDLDKRLSAAKQLLANHSILSNVFQLLEENTLPQVRFSSFALQADPARLELTGEAISYNTIAQQVRIFEALPSLQDVEFGGLQLGEKGLLKFKMTLGYKSDLIRWSGK